jgi:hypothetical protein
MSPGSLGRVPVDVASVPCTTTSADTEQARTALELIAEAVVRLRSTDPADTEAVPGSVPGGAEVPAHHE